MNKIDTNEQGKIKRMEKVMKGSANYWRIAILFLLDKESNLTVTDISESLGGTFVTISSHLQKLEASGFISKKYRLSMVEHRLTSLGKEILRFLRIVE